MAWLAHQIPRLPGSGIIYTLTVKDSERLAGWLRSQGIDAEPYNGAMETAERERLENLLIKNGVKALVATVALGMGFDKPDLGFVVHFQRPPSVVHYYQQVGRAGRAVENAFGVLMNGDEDDEIADYFIRTAFPSREDVDQLLAVLRDAECPLTVPKLQKLVNLSWGKVEQILKFLELESPAPVQKIESGYVLNPVPWEMPVERIRRITNLRRQEQERMEAYMASRGCLMEFLAAELNDPNAKPCGKCMNCGGHLLAQDYPAALSLAALDFLDRAGKFDRATKTMAAWV